MILLLQSERCRRGARRMRALAWDEAVAQPATAARRY